MSNYLLNKSTKTMTVALKVTDIKMIGLWKYNVENDICPICHYNLQHPTMKNIKEKTIKSYVSIGECKHGVHFNCMSRWLQTNMSCPICMTTWVPVRHVNSAVFDSIDA